MSDTRTPTEETAPAYSPAPDTPPAPTSWGRTLATALGLPALVAVILLAFSWPALTSDPHGIEIALVGPEETVTAVEEQLTADSEVYEVSTLEDRDAAVEAIETREVSGAIILGSEPELLTASANGTVNQVIAQLEAPLQEMIDAQSQAAAEATGQEAPEITLATTDVVPYAEDDASGALLSSAFFPLLFGGMIGGIAISLAVVGPMRRLVAVTVYAAVGSGVLVAILQGWYGAIQGDLWANLAAFALGIAAIAAPIVGAVNLLGRAGIAVGPVVMMLFANPIAGSQLPSQFLPGSWGEIGQWFPPGATATLVRELSYFPEAAMAGSWWVLIAWTVGGILLALLGHQLHRRSGRHAATA